MASPSMIRFQLPEDPVWLAAVGQVGARHEQLNYVLRMTIKSLTGVQVSEALLATEYTGAAELRRRVRKLARARLGESAALLKLEALLVRCEHLSRKRNELAHGVIGEELVRDVSGKELDGVLVMRAEDNTWNELPKTETLHQLRDDLNVLLLELNHARLHGWLAEALAAKGA